MMAAASDDDDDDDARLFARVHDLSDLELALLLCLVSREHGLLSTPADALDLVVRELQLAASRTFGLRCVVVDCHADMTLEHFASALLCAPAPARPSAAAGSPFRPQADSYFRSDAQRHSWRAGAPLSPGAALQIANCVLARNLDRAPRAVQIQALELLRTRRIFTRTSVQAAPRQFVFLPVLAAASGGEAHVAAHLNDFLAVAHWHDPDHGFANLDDLDDAAAADDDDDAGVGPSTGPAFAAAAPLISEAEIGQLAQLSQQVEVESDVLLYQMNIISFLRMHRAVAQGMTPAATKLMDKLTRCLATIHKLDFVTPALVALATRKVYLHRIRLTAPARERSLQWGSRLDAVEAVLETVGPEEVIQEVLDTVTAPL